MSRKQEDLESADKGWQEWLAFIDQRTALDQTVKGKDGWTLPEAMAHVARWQDRSVVRIQEFLNGAERDENFPFDEVNAEWAAEDAGISFAAAFQRAAASAIKLRAKVESVPDDRWDQNMHDVLAGNTWEHYTEHIAWH